MSWQDRHTKLKDAAGTSKHPVPRQERAAATRERLVRAARELVIERGYDDVATEDVLRRAGVSRGGLYHHFASKQELLAAVLTAVEQDLTVRLAAAVAGEPDPVSALSTGSQWYLDECLGSIELQRIGLHEGRKALGWEAWRAAIGPYGVGMLAEALRAGIEAAELRPADPTALAHLLLAALHEAVTIILHAPDHDAERARTGDAVAALIDGLRAR
jgi:AcrR family transcriptional regulator